MASSGQCPTGTSSIICYYQHYDSCYERSTTYTITSKALGTGGTGSGAGNNSVTGNCQLNGTNGSTTTTATFQGISAGN